MKKRSSADPSNTASRSSPVACSAFSWQKTSFLSALVVLLLLEQTVVGQTFHYSHGWTNGKRSGGTPGAPGAPGAPGGTGRARYLNAKINYDRMSSRDRDMFRKLAQNLEGSTDNVALPEAGSGSVDEDDAAFSSPFSLSPSAMESMSTSLLGTLNQPGDWNSPILMIPVKKGGRHSYKFYTVNPPAQRSNDVTL